MKQHIEPCESTLFSYYINVDGVGYPCSFCDGEEGYEGINVLECNDFVKDVWRHKETQKFRNGCIISGRKCQPFNLGLINNTEVYDEAKERIC